MNKQSDKDLWEEAYAAIIGVQQYSAAERESYMRSGRPLPPMIATGGGNQVMTTQNGINAITAIGEGWRIATKERKAQISSGKMREVSVNEFGRMLTENQMQLWADSVATVQDFKCRLHLRLRQIARDVQHYFPCRVLASPTARSFSVGPVQFMRRDEWLERITLPSQGDHEKCVALVRKAWTSGKQTAAALILRRFKELLGALADWASSVFRKTPRRRPQSEMHADNILRAIGRCQWVAVVRVTGNELGRSEERARYAVRLALDSLGMVLGASQALHLRGPGDEKNVRHHVSLSQFDGLDLNVGHRIDLPDLFAHPPHSEQFLSNTKDLRNDTGWAIESILKQPSEIDLAALKRRWCDALYWFGDARRDAGDFSALVRYGICLDVLAKGGKANGIVALMASLLGIAATDKYLTDGTTLRSVIHSIYNDGRSQIGHGGRPALLEDLPVDRGLADQVAQQALDLYLYRLRAYKGADDVDEFLAALPALTASVRASSTTP